MSVYSYDAEEHVKVTLQKSSRKKTVHSIELLKQYGVPYRIAIVIKMLYERWAEEI